MSNAGASNDRMGKTLKGLEELDPLTRKMVDRMKEQLLIVFMRRIMRTRGRDTGELLVPVREVDETGGYIFTLEVDENSQRFKFVLNKKH